MSNGYKIDKQEALRLAEQGKQIIERKGFIWAKNVKLISVMPQISRDSSDLNEILIAYAKAESEAGKPWIIQEINRWKRWLRRK